MDLERDGDRENYQCERETWVGCLPYVPRLGIESATQLCALTGNETHYPLVPGMML